MLEVAKDKIYLIFACICPFIWGFYWLYYKNFIIYNRYWDFMIFYFVGIQVLTDASLLYSQPHFYYLPSFAMIFTLYALVIPYVIAYYISYFMNIIFSMLFLRELDKILMLLNLKKKNYRFILLLLAANSWFLYFTFTFVQTKIFVGLVILYILRRELEADKKNIQKNRAFYIISYSLIVFAVGMAPSLILLLLIYFFYGINFNNIIKKENIEKFILILLIFLIQNIYFLFFPGAILDFLGGINWITSNKGTRCCFLYENPLPFLNNIYFSIISTILLLIFTVILIWKKTISLERKIGLFSTFYLFFGMYNCFTLFHILISFSLLLYVPYLNKKDKFSKLVKNNKPLLISLMAVGGINLMPPWETIIKYFPFILSNNFLLFMVINRYVILFIIYGSTLLRLLTRDPKNFYNSTTSNTKKI
ncbi:MAG: hypothetical protein ACTSVV_00755 [Promethearchaeota archaeon]